MVYICEDPAQNNTGEGTVITLMLLRRCKERMGRHKESFEGTSGKSFSISLHDFKGRTGLLSTGRTVKRETLLKL